MKKKLGQNFLRNKDISKSIVDLAEIPDNVEVFEIGPGDGSLTENLIKLPNKINLIEFDEELITPLRNRYKQNNVYIINSDARFYKLPTENKYSIIGNLPYYASNFIIRNFLFQKNIVSMTFTVQKEVGEQIVAPDGKKSFLSFLIQSHALTKKLLIIKNTEFYPVPKVDSMTIKIIPNDKKLDEDYINFVRKCFSSPRKKIANSIFKGLQIEISLIKEIIKLSELDENLRPQHLSLIDWENLYKVYRETNL
jgi:16S rRNA (adenine1518-N6/adenine1519-N6)-dimethyltransferase